MTRDELMHRLSRQPDWRATLMILTCVFPDDFRVWCYVESRSRGDCVQEDPRRRYVLCGRANPIVRCRVADQPGPSASICGKCSISWMSRIRPWSSRRSSHSAKDLLAAKNF